jgi:hypothetical protein
MTTAKAGAKSDPPTIKIGKKKPPVKDLDSTDRDYQEKVREMASNGETEFTHEGEDGDEIIVVERDDYEELYEKCWATKEYRVNSPGERLVAKFLQWAEPYATQSLIDWGAGSGRAGHKLYKENDLSVTLVDFASNALDENIAEEAIDNENLRFVKQDLSQPIDSGTIPVAEYGLCCDVLEHVPESQIDAVLDNILFHSRNVFIQISCMEDHFGMHDEIRGDKVRERLHVTVHGYLWWLQKFAERGVIVHRSEDLIRSCIFYVTAFQSQCFESIEGHLNVPPEVVVENIKYSSTLGLPSIGPMEVQDIEVMLVAGGPTTLDYKDEIIQQRKDGMKLITVNGSYNLMQDWGLEPSLQFLLDSRGFNKRFVEQSELTDKTKFVISSSADPLIFDLVPHDRTFIFHTSVTDEIMPILEEHYGPENEVGGVFPVPGGCTVTIRAICALRMLGFYKIHVYGMDSCVFPDRDHHAYPQVENDNDTEDVIEVTIARGSAYEKAFWATPWMIFQALDFKTAALKIMPDIQLNIKGDGMVAYMVETAAKLAENAGAEVELDLDETPGMRVYKDSRNRLAVQSGRPGQ